MYIRMIVDRVGNTNVFNVIHNLPSSTLSGEGQSLQSLTDDDLIQEYMAELREISILARSVSKVSSRVLGGEKGVTNHPQFSPAENPTLYEHLDIRKRLKKAGEVFFRQFFPPDLQTMITESSGYYLYFQVDPRLASIPLEILYDGKHFFWEKFYIGKSVKGRQTLPLDIPAKENLSLLIIADPTEDLLWARQEGERLYEYLSSNFPEKKLHIELISGRRITKLSLLNSIIGKDLIHYAGHLHYSSDPQENGWVLYGDKVIRSREIQKSGANPTLIFSNSCISGREMGMSENPDTWYENFAASFTKSGRTNYIGTIWELPDTEQTLKFTLQFYDVLFKGEPVGMALNRAREYARKNFESNDITWASYLLMGNPISKIFQTVATVPDFSRNLLDSNMVVEKYPYPIATAYQKFLAADKQSEEATPEKMETLLETFEQSILFCAALVHAGYDHLNLSPEHEFDPENLTGSIEKMYLALEQINKLREKQVDSHLSKVLISSKEEIKKMTLWKEKYDSSQIPRESLDGYMISLQYLMENFLQDIEFLKNFGFYKIILPGQKQLCLYGDSEYHSVRDISLPTQSEIETQNEITNLTKQYVGSCVFFIPVPKIFLNLGPFYEVEIQGVKTASKAESKGRFIKRAGI